MPPTTAVTPKHLLHEGTPAEIREALFEEDRAAFEAEYAKALDAAARTFSLAALESCMTGWRRTAAQQAHMGRERWDAMFDRARRIQAGERFPGAISGEEMKRQIRERLAAAQA